MCVMVPYSLTCDLLCTYYIFNFQGEILFFIPQLVIVQALRYDKVCMYIHK